MRRSLDVMLSGAACAGDEEGQRQEHESQEALEVALQLALRWSRQPLL
jgi:Tfp pilus assembly protein PilF